MVWREGSMSWKPIVVGLDGSPEAANAAVFAVAAAQRAATTFHLVHAVPRAERGRYPYTRRDEQIRRQVFAALGQRVPGALAALSIHGGQPAAVLNGAVAALGAELVVLGASTILLWGAGWAAAPA